MKSRYRITMAERPHFLTCTILNWLSIFSFRQFTDIVIDSLAFLQRNDRLVVHGYVIMVNHLHLIARSRDLSKEIGDFKSFTARRIIDELEAQNRLQLLSQMKYFKQRYKPDREYQLWQEGSYPKLIYNEMMMRQKLMYIHNNPVKSGYVDDPLHWKYSSARNYAGLDGELEVCTDW